jgi:hypothetical protein
LFGKAAMLHMLNENPLSAAQAYCKGGDCASEGKDKQLTLSLYDKACEMYESESRGDMSEPTFKKAVSFAVKSELWADAVMLLKRQMNVAKDYLEQFETDLYANMLSILIIYFHQERYEEAEVELNLLTVDAVNWFSSDYCRAADELLQAYHRADQEVLDDAVNRPGAVYKLLVNPVGRLAKKLRLSDAVIAKGPTQSNDDLLLGGGDEGLDSEEEEEASGEDYM